MFFISNEGALKDNMGETLSVNELLRQEKTQHIDDFDAEFASNVVKGDEDFDGDTLRLKPSKRPKPNDKNREKEKHKAINQYHKREKALSMCRLCLDNEKNFRSEEEIISKGTRVYLAVPSKLPFVTNACQIVPFKHSRSLVELDEDVYEEVKNFKKCLVKMFASRGLDCIFYETVMGLKRDKHTILHCIPLSPEHSSLSPMYFKVRLQPARSVVQI